MRAGLACFGIVRDALERAAREARSIDEIASLIVDEVQRDKKRLPGFGHRVYREDPRATVVLQMADELGKSGDGVRFVRAVEAALASHRSRSR